MSFSCGCFVVPGGKVTPKLLKKHLEHTFEAMLFWELLGRRTRDDSYEFKKRRLSEARQQYIDAVTAVYPEAVQGKGEAQEGKTNEAQKVTP